MAKNKKIKAAKKACKEAKRAKKIARAFYRKAKKNKKQSCAAYKALLENEPLGIGKTKKKDKKPKNTEKKQPNSKKKNNKKKPTGKTIKKKDTTSKTKKGNSKRQTIKLIPSIKKITKPKAKKTVLAKTKTVAVEDNLKKIEGIGPKIEGLLKADGIQTFKALAEAKVETIKEILIKAGPRYKMHNPATWGDQAALAQNGQWEALKKLQGELKGGRKV